MLKAYLKVISIFHLDLSSKESERERAAYKLFQRAFHKLINILVNCTSQLLLIRCWKCIENINFPFGPGEKTHKNTKGQSKSPTLERHHLESSRVKESTSVLELFQLHQVLVNWLFNVIFLLDWRDRKIETFVTQNCFCKGLEARPLKCQSSTGR